MNPGRVQTIIGVEGLEHTATSTILGEASSETSMGQSAATTLSTAMMSTGAINSQTPTATTTAFAAGRKTTDKPGIKAAIAVSVFLGVIVFGFLAWFIYKRYFSGTRWRSDKRPEVPKTSAPMAPSTEQDPYIPGNAANVAHNPTALSAGWKSPATEKFDSGNAPYGNAYERNAPSRGPLANSATTLGTGTLGEGGYGGQQATGRALSFVSDKGPNPYARSRANELGH